MARSKLTAQGQISIPAAVRKRLGVGPGAVIEWVERDGAVLVQRAATFTSEDVHRVLFPEGPPRPHSLADLKTGIAQHVRGRHARR